MKIVKEIPEKVLATLKEGTTITIDLDKKIDCLGFIKIRNGKYEIKGCSGDLVLVGLGEITADEMSDFIISCDDNRGYLQNPNIVRLAPSDRKTLIEYSNETLSGCSCRASSKKPAKKPATRKPAARKTVRR